jgi:hypothetical protein
MPFTVLFQKMDPNLGAIIVDAGVTHSGADIIGTNFYYVSAFRTRGDRQPTSKFVVVCPCPDGLMQDGTQEGNVACVISHRGACSRGYKRLAWCVVCSTT